MTETCALGCALDYAGDVRHDKAPALIDVHHTKVGEQRRKVVVSDLGVSLAHDAEQRGFAHVGEADKTDVGKQLQLKRNVVRFSRQTGLCKAGDLTGGRRKMLVAPAASAALCDDVAFAVGHIVHDGARFGVTHEGASGNLYDKALAVLTGAALA